MSSAKGASDAASHHKILNVIEQDLRSLATNANRKFPEVKDAVERALLRIRATHEQLAPSASAAEQAVALAASEDVLLPLMLALACKSDTLPELALKAVQRMLSHNAVAPQRLPAVVSQLIARAQSPAADEPSLLRVLQTVLTIASSPALLHNDTVVAQLLLLCLTLQQHRSGNIRNTAVATVQQFIALLLDIVASEPDPTAGSRGDLTQRPELGALSVAARCTFLAFQDLCLLANGESAQWLPGTGPVRIQFALEMVQRTLQSHSELFMHRRPFQYLLKERACPLLLKTMQQPASQQEWGAMLRLMHLTATLLCGYAHMLRTEAEILLSMLARTLAAEATPVWHRALILEVFRVLVQHETLLQHIFTSYDVGNAASGVLAKLAQAVAKVLTSAQVDFATHAEYIETHYLRLSKAASNAAASRTFSLALYSEADGTALAPDYMAALAVQSHVLLTTTIARLAEASTVEPQAPPQPLQVAHAACGASSVAAAHNVSAAHTLKAATLGQHEVVRGMVSGCWQALLTSLSLVLARCSSEEIIQVILKCYQSFTQACGMLDLVEPRDAFLSSLCRYALPPRLATRQEAARPDAISFAPADSAYEPLPFTTLSAKNVQALKSLFNIAHCLGGLLGASWNLVLATLEQLDRIIASSKSHGAHGSEVAIATAAGAGAVARQHSDTTLHELSILSTALSNLFSGSARLSDEAIRHFLTALSTQCFASLAHEATSRERLVPGASTAPLRLFALSCFVDVALHNMHRVLLLWPIVTQLLLPAANHKSARIRIVGIEALVKVVIAAMRHHMQRARDASKPQGASDEAAAAAPAAAAAAPAAEGGEGEGAPWDKTLMAPLEELQRRCVHRETQESILGAVHKILQACGADLLAAWPLLLSVLWRAATLPALASLLPLGFRSVQLIASDFLGVLPASCLLAYVEVAAVYATQRKHLNVALTAVGLQWTIGDFLKTRPRDASSDEAGEALARQAERRAEEAAEATVAATGGGPVAGAAAARPGEGSFSPGAPGAAPAAAAESEEEAAVLQARLAAPRFAALDVAAGASAHELWCVSLRQLRVLSVDERPEVRTCSMHSLTSILTAHGGSLGASTWDYALFRALLPLVTELTQAAASASTLEDVAEQLGTDEHGQPVLSMVHHSRNTASKQWDETWVLALTSVTRLFRTFLPLLQQRLPPARFERAWHGLLGFCELSLTSSARSQEVALAAIGALQQLLLSSAISSSSVTSPKPAAALATHASDEEVMSYARSAVTPRGGEHAVAAELRRGGSYADSAESGAGAPMERLPAVRWVAVWGVIERGVAAALSDARYEVHGKMLTRLLAHFAEVYGRTRESFEEADVLRLLQLASKLAAPPDANAGWSPTSVARLPSALQLAVHHLLEALPPFPTAVSASNLWPLLLWQLLKFIEPTLPVERAPPPPAEKPRDVACFAERAHALLLRLFTEEAQPSAKLVVFEDVMQVFRGVVAWRRHPSCACPSLPRAVAASMGPMVDAILPQLRPPATSQSRTASTAADTVGRAQAELVSTLCVLLAPPAHHALPQPDGGVEAVVAQPLDACDGAGDGAGAVRLPRDLSEEEMALEVELLGVTARVVRSCGDAMPPPLCSRPLRLLQAVLVLPAATATQRDASWRVALAALCELSAAKGVSRLAAPLLTAAATRVLSEWAEMSGALADGLLEVRAEQLLLLLSEVAKLRLAAGSLGPSPGATEALARPLQGARAQLVVLVPALVACIGKPARQPGGAAAEAVQRLHEALREALQQVVDELGFPPLCLDLD